MSTSVWSTPLDHTSNAGFQAWATELIVKLLAVNTGQFTQTADTGQLANPVVAARPGASTAAGYWMFKWDDGVSTPLYLKIEVGTGTSASFPAIWYTIGTSTNGSGTIGGSASARTNLCNNTIASSTTTNFTSHLCVDTGGFGLAWKESAAGATIVGEGIMVIGRSIDDSGVVNNDGYLTVSLSQGTSYFAQSVNLSNGVSFTSTGTSFLSTSWTLIPFAITSSVVSGDAQYFRVFAAYPLARPIGHFVVCITNEFGGGTSFAGESGSITDHTFISTGNCGHAGSYSIAMLWQ